MAEKVSLSKTMTEAEFDCGYWYATELRAFAREIGIPSVTRLRKDELEVAVKRFLRTGEIAMPTRRKLNKTGPKDTSIGLQPELPIVNYVNDKETWSFIVHEAGRRVPSFKEKSGARYRLNRWREEQLTAGATPTYGDLVEHYITLCQFEGSFAHVPVGRYINFVADFLANENGATRPEAIEAWKQLKEMDVPKTYADWKTARNL